MTTPCRILDNPYLELAMGLVLLTAGALEIRDVFLVKLPGRGPMLPHALAAVGAALVLRSLPGIFLGLELADSALDGFGPKGSLAVLDRLVHSHAADLAMGFILVAAGLADLGDVIVLKHAWTLLDSATGAVVFGLAPLADALLVLYKGARRIDRERPERLLDRAVRNPWVQAGAGLFMLACGLSDFMAACLFTTAGAGAQHGPTITGGLTLLGLYGLVSGLPGVYEGLKTLSRSKTV